MSVLGKKSLKNEFCQDADIPKGGGSGSFSVTLGADKANSGSAGELFGVLPSTATSCSRGKQSQTIWFPKDKQNAAQRSAGPGGQRWEMGSAFGSHLVIWLSDRPGRTLVQRGLHKAWWERAASPLTFNAFRKAGACCLKGNIAPQFISFLPLSTKLDLWNCSVGGALTHIRVWTSARQL